MAGIYIHIPFCKTKCNYCDFYKSTRLNQKVHILDSIKTEFNLRKQYLRNDSISTIYFGGGTPSVLEIAEITELLDLINQNYSLNKNVEITLEANPEDLSLEYLSELKEVGVNRLSIGIQSFDDEDLKLMNRRHTSDRAKQAVKDARCAGFDNISIDLIYGLPKMTNSKWETNLKQAFALDAEHISSYHLTYHSGTVFNNYLKKGIIKPIPEDDSFEQFKMLVSEAQKQGYEQYEISNFAKNEKYSQHNSSYWKGQKYLGIGPSAHSFDGYTRQWNVANNNRYIEAISKGANWYTLEELSKNDRFNDYIITRLRTKWGIDYDEIEQQFGNSAIEHIKPIAEKYIKSQHLYQQNRTLKLNLDGLFISDEIMMEMMMID